MCVCVCVCVCVRACVCVKLLTLSLVSFCILDWTGLDWTGLDWTVQVGLPSDKAQYIHRLGRTARAGKAGHGILLLCDFESVSVWLFLLLLLLFVSPSFCVRSIVLLRRVVVVVQVLSRSCLALLTRIPCA